MFQKTDNLTFPQALTEVAAFADVTAAGLPLSPARAPRSRLTPENKLNPDTPALPNTFLDIKLVSGFVRSEQPYQS